MQSPISCRVRALAAWTCAAALGAAAPLPGHASAATADLRVEAGGQILTSASYATSAQWITTDSSHPACGGTGQTRRLDGSTALGLLAGAARQRPALKPLRISDSPDSRLRVCGMFDFMASHGAWHYKVNHVSPGVGAETFRITDGDEVLWYFRDLAQNRNTGAELVVEAPVRARERREVPVTVYAYGPTGARTPAAGARVLFSTRPKIADAAGRAKGRLEDGELIRAGRGSDIPSAAVSVCIAPDLDECPPARGKRVMGSARADRIRGTAGTDIIRSGAGNDRIDVRGGGEDRVRCGSGRRDRVRLNGDDRATADCEIVNGRRRDSKRR